LMSFSVLSIVLRSTRVHALSGLMLRLGCSATSTAASRSL
jgi:hypothetical protein